MNEMIEPHDPIPDCDCRNCACRERDKLREVLRRIAEHHEEQRDAWGDEEGDADQARYHEERRNFAMFHVTPNEELSGPRPLAAEGSRSNDVLERGGKGG